MLIKKATFIAFCFFLYVCAVIQFIRYYVVSTYFYLDMPRYLSGHERLPFQERVLPVFLMWPINHSSFLMRHLAHNRGDIYTPSAATPETLAFYILSLISFSLASFFVYRLYCAVSPTRVLSPLILPIFMVLTLWSYVVHIDANFSYPYDMPSLAFFSGGLLAIYKRRFFPLALIMLFGTINRETTLFLVGIYALDAASLEISGDQHLRLMFADRFSLKQVSITKTASLFAIWLIVKLTIHHHFRHNDNSENFVRFRGNLGRLIPRLWPALFNICGYMLPIVLVLYTRIRPIRFANYLFIFPLWFAIMMYTGVIVESRIFGELCPYIAIATVLLLEHHIHTLQLSLRNVHNEAEALALEVAVA